jgi:hypothetical protein
MDTHRPEFIFASPEQRLQGVWVGKLGEGLGRFLPSRVIGVF